MIIIEKKEKEQMHNIYIASKESIHDMTNSLRSMNLIIRYINVNY